MPERRQQIEAVSALDRMHVRRRRILTVDLTVAGD
jgi:hypothetical protein